MADNAKASFDSAAELVALRKKYAEERAKRLRADGSLQYREVKAEFGRLLDDPFAHSVVEREGIKEEVDVVIVGGGYAGLLTAIRLRQAGVDSFRMIEKASDVGGTWYWNRYPGAACDIESTVYLPLLEETGYSPREKYAKASEIFEYCRGLAKRFGIYDTALFQTQVQEFRWNEEARRWFVKTDQGDEIRARFISIAVGNLSKPKLPGIPGIESFKGHFFHTCRWDYEYTGGDESGGLTKLQDKTVAVVGTGATAVQVIPQLAKWSKHLFVFQRTPSSVDVRNNALIDPDWLKSLQPGWQRERLLNFEAMTLGINQEKDLVGDAWTDLTRALGTLVKENESSDGPTKTIDELLEIADFRKMEWLRQRVDQIVQDPEVAAALKPYFRLHCKRPCFSDDYLPSFNRPNVTLVNTMGHGVERITENGLVCQGEEYPVDCIVYATGFEVMAMPFHAGGFSIYGAGGVSLKDRWSDGIKSLHGVSTHGFPNMFISGGVRDGGGAFNAHFVIENNSRHVADIISRCLKSGVTRLELTEQAEVGWRQIMQDKAGNIEQVLAECTPGYLNNEGAGGPDSLRAALYGGGSIEFFEMLEQWRANGFEGDFKVERAG
jgi:cyclohexanone monooxygenase